MEDKRVDAEFDRMELNSRVEHDRAMIIQYETGLAFRRQQVEKSRYELGRLDERLGGGQ